MRDLSSFHWHLHCGQPHCIFRRRNFSVRMIALQGAPVSLQRCCKAQAFPRADLDRCLRVVQHHRPALALAVPSLRKQRLRLHVIVTANRQNCTPETSGRSSEREPVAATPVERKSSAWNIAQQIAKGAGVAALALALVTFPCHHRPSSEQRSSMPCNSRTIRHLAPCIKL
jgi:hypothetical protein